MFACFCMPIFHIKTAFVTGSKHAGHFNTEDYDPLTFRELQIMPLPVDFRGHS